MEQATTNQQNAHYNDEVLFLDGIAEAHPEVLEALTAEEKNLLRAYYLIGYDAEVENIFEYRKALLAQDASLEARAKAVFNKILHELQIENFTYTTGYPGT